MNTATSAVRATGRLHRIAMFVHTLDDRAVAGLALALCGHLRRAGLEVFLICATRDPRSTIRVPDGVAVVDLGVGPRRTTWGVLSLARLLPRIKPDVLFAHGSGPARASIIARVLARSSARVIVVEHTPYEEAIASGRWLKRRLIGGLYPYADRLAGVSPGVVDGFAARLTGLRGRTAVLPAPGPEPEDVSGLSSPVPDHPWFSRRDGVRLICAVGNVIPRKGQDTLIRALPLVREQLGDVRLVLVGRLDDATYFGQLQELCDRLDVADHVWFAGHSRRPLTFMAGSHVFALASTSEGFGMVLVEAMACGIPVVASDCPTGPSFVLDAGRYGVLVPSRDVAAMAQGIATVLADKDLRERLISGGRERAARFAPRQVAEEYRRLAEECLVSETGLIRGSQRQDG